MKKNSSTIAIEAKDKLFLEAGGKLLTFLIDSREYAICILDAREVVGIQNIDPVPLTPPYVKGVINLRGKIIPIVDLRLKFGIAEKEFTKDSCIVVVEIDSLMTGIIVDQLIGVVGINEEDYEATPLLGQNIQAEYVEGMVKLTNRVIIVLNCEKILIHNEQKIEALSEKEIGDQFGMENSIWK